MLRSLRLNAESGALGSNSIQLSLAECFSTIHVTVVCYACVRFDRGSIGLLTGAIGLVPLSIGISCIQLFFSQRDESSRNDQRIRTIKGEGGNFASDGRVRRERIN